MTKNESHRHETEALIQAIWGPAALDPPPSEPVRQRQNRELAAALKAYLQEYLTEM